MPVPDSPAAIIDRILAVEGGQFTNSPADSGGPTKWGITQATLSDYLGRPATVSEVQSLSREDAARILYAEYVQRPHFAEVVTISASIGARLIDGGVLCGPPILAQFLQRCLNALNLNGTKYPDIPVDGGVGPATLASLRAYLTWRGEAGEHVLLEAMECLLGARFIEDVERRPKDEQWLYGWLLNRVGLV